MKRTLAILWFVLASCAVANAGTWRLTWQASTSPETVGYRLYSHDYTGPFNYASPMWEGTALTAEVMIPDDRQTAFVVRAYSYGPYDLEGNRTVIESGDSNVWVAIPDSPVVNPPGGLGGAFLGP